MENRKRDPDQLTEYESNRVRKRPVERMVGPSDSSDTGADMMGLGAGDETSDREGTGERASVEDDPSLGDSSDISADRVVPAEEAGLGGGLDQAEEAQLGITDEELDRLLRRRK